MDASRLTICVAGASCLTAGAERLSNILAQCLAHDVMACDLRWKESDRLAERRD